MMSDEQCKHEVVNVHHKPRRCKFKAVRDGYCTRHFVFNSSEEEGVNE